MHYGGDVCNFTNETLTTQMGRQREAGTLSGTHTQNKNLPLIGSVHLHPIHSFRFSTGHMQLMCSVLLAQ